MKTDSFTFSSIGTVGRSDAKLSSDVTIRKELENVVNWVRKQFEKVPASTDLPTAVVVVKSGTVVKVDSYLQVVINGVTYKLALVS